ncbi:MAG: NAD(P)/FAD-dependent oxidoreductase [Ignavibacteriaceae bacterium]
MALNHFDVIIIGGSYGGLSAAMALGRSLRNVLIIDNNQPCNRFTPHSHNFLTHDGDTPEQIKSLALTQVKRYSTINFYDGFAASVKNTSGGFEVSASDNSVFISSKIILAAGIKDIMPDIKGFAECWGRTVIHCPYCHGYEYKDKKTGILANGEAGYHYVKLVSNLTKDIVLFTNGKAEFTQDQLSRIRKHNIPIIETGIIELDHTNGILNNVRLDNGSVIPLTALYNIPAFEHHSDITKQLKCEMTDNGLIKVDELQRTSIPGVFACGDNSNKRAVSVAVASGTLAGTSVNNELAEELF